MQSVDQKILWYQSKFQAFERSLNGEKLRPVHALRRDAIRQFTEIGFPTTRQEEWRFTNISPITNLEFQPILGNETYKVKIEDIMPYVIEGAVRLVFINGIFSADLSDVGKLPKGILIGNLAELLEKNSHKAESYIASLVKGDENAFTALNTAFIWDGAFVFIPRGIILARTLQFVFIATDSKNMYAAQPRNLIVVEPDCQLKIAEIYLSLAKNTYLINTVTEIFIGENSIVEHNKVQIENLNAYHIGTTHIKMNTLSNYTSNVISLGGSIVRNNITSVLEAEGAECTLNGLSLGTGTQLIDNHTVIDHAKPNCKSHELYKSILGGASKGVFNGKIFVRKDAQKTDAKQTNKTLLLSDDATINTKPQLEIFADDVKCTHGATIGQLDAEQIFYLRSRGIGETAARDILTFAFAEDVVNRITIEPLRRQLTSIIQERLDKSRTSNQ